MRRRRCAVLVLLITRRFGVVLLMVPRDVRVVFAEVVLNGFCGGRAGGDGGATAGWIGGGIGGALAAADGELPPGRGGYWLFVLWLLLILLARQRCGLLHRCLAAGRGADRPALAAVVDWRLVFDIVERVVCFGHLHVALLGLCLL